MLVLTTPGEPCEGSLSLTSVDHKKWAATFDSLDGVVFWHISAMAKLMESLPVLSKMSSEGLGRPQRTRRWTEVSDAYLSVSQAQQCCVAHGSVEKGVWCTVQEFLRNEGSELLPLVVAALAALTPDLLEGTCKLFALAPQHSSRRSSQDDRQDPPAAKRAKSAIHRLFTCSGVETVRLSACSRMRAHGGAGAATGARRDDDHDDFDDDSPLDISDNQSIQSWTLEQGATIADKLRKWAPSIVAGLPPEEAESEKVHLEGSISWIETLVQGWQPSQRHGHQGLQGHHQVYSDVEMLRWWSLSGAVKNISDLKTTLQRSLESLRSELLKQYSRDSCLIFSVLSASVLAFPLFPKSKTILSQRFELVAILVTTSKVLRCGDGRGVSFCKLMCLQVFACLVATDIGR